MITITELRNSMNGYKELSQTTLYRYIVQLLEALDNDQLLELIANPEAPYFIRKNAWRILHERINNVNNNGLPHHDAIDDQR